MRIEFRNRIFWHRQQLSRYTKSLFLSKIFPKYNLFQFLRTSLVNLSLDTKRNERFPPTLSVQAFSTTFLKFRCNFHLDSNLKDLLMKGSLYSISRIKAPWSELIIGRFQREALGYHFKQDELQNTWFSLSQIASAPSHLLVQVNLEPFEHISNRWQESKHSLKGSLLLINIYNEENLLPCDKTWLKSPIIITRVSWRIPMAMS